jgi:hypothetical protein
MQSNLKREEIMIYAINEPAIVCNCTICPDANGEVVIIKSGLMPIIVDDEVVLSYLIGIKINGQDVFVPEANLQKMPPPHQSDRLEKMHWCDGDWSPYQNSNYMALARELKQVRDKTSALRRRPI